MDPNLHLTYPQRIKRIRLSIRYTIPKFCRVMGITPKTYYELLRGSTPTLHTIRRIRLMERAFAEFITDKYDRSWGKTEKVYEKYGGDIFHRINRYYRSSNILPVRKADIEALGGMEVFGTVASHVQNDDREDEGSECLPPSARRHSRRIARPRGEVAQDSRVEPGQPASE